MTIRAQAPGDAPDRHGEGVCTRLHPGPDVYRSADRQQPEPWLVHRPPVG